MSRLLLDDTATPAWNMAVDEALLRLVTVPVLRVYRWDCPAVSLGYFQEHALVPAGRPFVRRYTGGGLVDHARDVTYTLVFPRTHPIGALPMPESYARIHAGVKAALAAAGITAELSPNCAEDDSPACFQKPVKYDVMWKKRKLAGAAQRRTREGTLHQGSILPPEPDARPRVRAALPAALAQALDEIWEPSRLTEAETDKARSLEKDRYDSDRWNRQK